MKFLNKLNGHEISLEQAWQSSIQKVRVTYFLELFVRWQTQDNFEKGFEAQFLNDPLIKKQLIELIKNTLINFDLVEFYSELGVINSQSFFKEFVLRVTQGVLPQYKNYNKLSVIAKDDLFLPDDKWDLKLNSFLRNMAQHLDAEVIFVNEIKSKNRDFFKIAKKIIISRVATLAAEEDFRNFLSIEELNAFLFLSESSTPIDFNNCILLIENVHGKLEKSGISIELVFLLTRMKKLLYRLILLSEFDENQIGELSNFLILAEVIYAEYGRQKKLTSLIDKNLSLISKKIVERAGVTGDHYIARTKAESLSLFLSSAGGGFITVFTAVFKVLISKIGLPLFIEGIFSWANYSLSFIFMQFAHLTLATKTPAMTASVLAKKLKDFEGEQNWTEFAQEVNHWLRSSAIAVFGNVTFVFLGAIAFDQIYFLSTGHHFLTEIKAKGYLQSHHLFSSLTLWYAFYTGALLWLASVVGGWFENWYVYRKLPLAIEENQFLNQTFGAENSKKISQWVSHHIMGLSTNISLGGLLAFTTIFGAFFGLPLDVRHVTLSSGALAFSLMGLNEVAISDFNYLIIFALLSIPIIGFLNLSVSFFISILLAAEARQIRLKDYPFLIAFTFKRLIKKKKI